MAYNLNHVKMYNPVSFSFLFKMLFFFQASDFSDVGDWPTLGEAAMAVTVVRPKEEIVAATGSSNMKSRLWADEV